MSNYAEDQALEVEALEAIYPKEFEKIADSPLQWKVHVVPHPDGEGENHVAIDMVCTIGETYPDEPPQIDVVVKQGLSDAQAQELMALAHQTAQDNVGIAMGYTMAEALREWLADNNVSATDGSMHANMLRRMDEKTKADKRTTAQRDATTTEEDDLEALRKRRLAEGTPVTADTFAKWRDKFEAEQAALRPAEVVGEKRLTGKQMFLQHLVREDASESESEEGEEEEFDQEFDLLAGEDEGLFEGDDADLEGLSDQDEEELGKG